MIRRSLRRSFRAVYWRPPKRPTSTPTIFCANHNGWFDGYVMFAALTALHAPFLLWMEEYATFPPFGKCGALPYPVGDSGARASTVKQTIRTMRAAERSLLLFPEGTLHRPGELLPFGRSLEFLSAKVPEASVVPVGIRYEMSLHERPECFVAFGAELEAGADLARRTRQAVAQLKDQTQPWSILVQGAKDINERMSFRRKGSHALPPKKEGPEDLRP